MSAVKNVLLPNIASPVIYVYLLYITCNRCTAEKAYLSFCLSAAFAGCAVFGPSMGYVLGGIFLQRYVDFYKVDPDE